MKFLTKTPKGNTLQKNNSWGPQEGQDPTLDTFIKMVKLDHLTFDFQPSQKHNISKAQYKGLKELSEIPHIVYKKLTKTQPS